MKTNRGIVALLVTVMIWGSTFVVTKSALQDMGPLALNALRFVIAFVILWPLARRQGYRLGMSVEPTFWRFGLSGVALYYSLQNLGLVYTSAVNTVLVLTIIPAVTALLAVWLLHERLHTRQVVGIALAVVGAAVVGVFTKQSHDAPRPWLGNLMIAGSVLSWAIYTIQGKRLSTHYSALVTTTASAGAGLLILLPLAVGEMLLGGLPRLSPQGGLAVLYLGLLATALPMFLWNYALSYVDASVASLYLNLVPVVGVIIALLAGEGLGLGQIVGGCLTLLGVWVSGQRE
jgi:drug/metabolite transporter (DMT)-like permease